MRLDDEVEHLYRRAREAFLAGDLENAERWYRHLRSQHACDLYYEVELPADMRLIHPVGVVLNRATYGQHLVVYNGVSVGATLSGKRPILGEGVCLLPGCRILDDVVIGDNVFVMPNVVLIGKEIPPNSIVTGDSIMNTTRSVVGSYWV